MTIIEVSLVIIAVLLTASLGVLIGVVVNLGRTLHVLQELVRNTTASARRIDEVGSELQDFLNRAGSDYRQVSDVARTVLQEVAIPVKGAVAVIRGLRTGITSFLRPSIQSANSTQHPRSRA